MGSVKVTGTQNRVDNVYFSVAVSSTAATDSAIVGCRATGAVALSGPNQFSDNYVTGAVTVSTGSVGVHVTGNRFRGFSAARLIDKGVGTFVDGNSMFNTSETAKMWNFEAAVGPDLAQAHQFNFNIAGTVSTGTIQQRWYPPYKGQIIDVRAIIGSLTGSTTEFIIDANVDGVSLFGATKVVLSTGLADSGFNSPDSGSVFRVEPTEAITVDVDQAGVGSGLNVMIRMLPVLNTALSGYSDGYDSGFAI